MEKVKIEFFHDVICSFCFPMSYRMRQLVEQMEYVEIALSNKKIRNFRINLEDTLWIMKIKEKFSSISPKMD